MAYKNLDDLRIENPIIRSYLHRDILELIENDSSDLTFPYDVNVDEEFRPDLISVRAYNTDTLRWVVLLVAKLSSERDSLPVGGRLVLPSSSWVLERILHYVNNKTLVSTIKVSKRV